MPPAAGPSQGNAKTAAIQAQIDDTVGIMRENITKVAERGERLDSLQDKTGTFHVCGFGDAMGPEFHKSYGIVCSLINLFEQTTLLSLLKDSVEEQTRSARYVMSLCDSRVIQKILIQLFCRTCGKL